MAALRFWCLNIEACGAASTELLHRVVLLYPPYTWMWMEQSSLQGVDPVPAREARQQGVITGKQRVWLETGWKRTTSYREKKKKNYQGEALKRKERYGWGLISKSGSYEGKWICESARGSPTKLHGIAIAVTAQDGSNVNFFASWCSSRKKLGDALNSIFMVEGKLQIVSRELNSDLLFFEATWQRTVGQQRERPPLKS